MLEVTNGCVNYYGAVDRGGCGDRVLVLLISQTIGMEVEVERVIISQHFFELHNYDGFKEVYPIDRLVSVSFKDEE